MAIIVVQTSLTKEDLSKAREDYSDYIKVTVDVEQKLVAIGGEYHVDAEQVLLEKYDSKQKDLWGGGYNLTTKQFELIAIINIRHDPENQSMEILDPDIRKSFLILVNEKLKGIEFLL
jgi:hypothetical protein